jgi:hypothetical protein
MSALSEEAGAIYLHVLQPNQYVEGSKVLDPVELDTAYQPENLTSRAARLGYPVLREAGPGLRERGIHFVDLTMVFEHEQGTIYRDVCCHYNNRGYEILGEAIAAELVSALRELGHSGS